ncbi:putative ribonuclease H-like domain-containing protein, partial [Tanacetum coccineum]
GMPQQDDKGFVDNGCSRHMTGNIAYLSDFKEFDGGYVAFGGGAYGGRITGKGTLKTDNLDFEDLSDKNQILLKILRKDNMYSFDMKNIVPKESLTCLIAEATLDESMLWHRRLSHINFKNINKLVKDSLVRGLPTKHFENKQTCVACLKGKQHRASCKSNILNPITKPLFMLHMDLFGPTFVSSLMHKKEKGIKREYSVARTPQQNGVAKRRNRTLIEAARTIIRSKKGSDEVSTAGAKKGTASDEVLIVSTAEVNLSTAGETINYTRRSAEKWSRQDKGKAIMIEFEPKKKSKNELEQERLSFSEAIRLEEQMNEEQRAHIERDEEIARQWDEEERQRAMVKPSLYDIELNDLQS